MILEEETFETFGYYPSELKPQSNMPVVAACDVCGETRVVSKDRCSSKCRSCSQRRVEIYEWVDREQHKHFCQCGCGREITIQRHHFWKGIPKYISGHNSRIENPMDNPVTRKKISEALSGEGNPMYGKTGEKHPTFGKHLSEEHKEKISIANTGRNLPEEHRKRISEAMSGEKHPMYGKKGKDNPLFGTTLSEKHKEKISIANTGKIRSEEQRKRISEATSGEKNPMFGKHPTEETKKKLSAAKSGEKHPLYGICGEEAPNWRGGISFEPYCPKFNNAFKESIREKFGRVCFLCPTTEEENGRKLSVHHTNYNKDCLCDDSDCEFVPLCDSCHSKTNFNREYWENLILTKLGVLS